MQTVVCVGGGPSLTAADVDACRDQTVIAINDSYRLAPWATALYAADAAWWAKHQGVPSFLGTRYACQLGAEPWGAIVLKNLGMLGWSDDPWGVFTGGHSGYQAIQVAAHLGATRIVLLGYDVQASAEGKMHWHENPTRQPFARWVKTYATLAAAALERGIEIVNCSRATALTDFPRRSLAETLA